MITASPVSDWRDLQDQVARILNEAGLSAEVDVTIPLARGKADVDILAVEPADGRRYTVLCECKHWARAVDRGVVREFRTVVADSGANVGYIIGSSGFQSGAAPAADLTNIRLVTWREFQDEFEASWTQSYLAPQVAERFNRLFNYTEYTFPRVFSALDEVGRGRFAALHDKHAPFGWFMMTFTPFAADFLAEGKVPALPLRGRMPIGEIEHLPDDILDAPDYRGFLEAATRHGASAMAEFQEVIDRHVRGGR